MGSAQRSLVTLMGTVCEWDMQTDMVIYIRTGMECVGLMDQWHCIGVGLPALCSINTQHVKPSAGSGNSALNC